MAVWLSPRMTEPPTGWERQPELPGKRASARAVGNLRPWEPELSLVLAGGQDRLPLQGSPCVEHLLSWKGVGTWERVCVREVGQGA